MLSDQVKTRWLSQLMKSNPRVLKKLLNFFNGTIISTFFVPLLPVAPVGFCLNLNKTLLSAAWKLTITLALVKVDSSL